MLIRDITAAEWMTKEGDRRVVRDELETLTERRMYAHNPYKLTFREFTVVAFVAGGAGDKQIATELGISVFTVGKHVSNIPAKMSVASRAEASVRAIQEHLLE
jgi:DNA-binding NarL/FixJ family response regulator